MKIHKRLTSLLALTLSFSAFAPLAHAEDIWDHGDAVATSDQVTPEEANEVYTDDEMEAMRLRRPRAYTCYAENARRQYFIGRGYTRAAARDRALRNCFYRSAHCRLVSCHH